MYCKSCSNATMTIITSLIVLWDLVAAGYFMFLFIVVCLAQADVFDYGWYYWLVKDYDSTTNAMFMQICWAFLLVNTPLFFMLLYKTNNGLKWFRNRNIRFLHSYYYSS